MSISPQDKSTIFQIIQNALQATNSLSNLHNDVLVDTDLAGKILSIPAKTLVRWRSSGEVQIPFIRINRHIRYRTIDLLAYIESHSHHKTSLTT